MGKEWLCAECDWIGSPEVEPDECPNCGAIGTLDDISVDADDDDSPDVHHT